MKTTDLTSASLEEMQHYATKNFGHLNGPKSAEMRAAFRQACSGGIQHEPEPPRTRTGTVLDWAHLNGPERAAEMRAAAIIASGAKARGETAAPKPTGLANKIVAAAAKTRKPTTLPKPTGLAAKIVAAARKCVRL